LLRALILLTDDALARYEQLKQQDQKLDFDDLIERTQNLLVGDDSVGDSASESRRGFALRQLSRNLRAVLVDEFQDTNWTQAKMLTALAGNKAKLFLIGDDKQSIYKFQGADVGTFNACKTYISTLDELEKTETVAAAKRYGLPLLSGSGQLMTLSQSFRSHPQIVNFVNLLFRTLFDGGSDSAEFKSRFQALRPARSAENDEAPRIDIIYTPAVDEEKTEQRAEIEQSEADLVARWINEKVANKTQVFDKALQEFRSLDYADFAVLLQANSDFAIVEKTLAAAGIPYVSIAGSGFLDRQEILDLENVLKWVNCPQDSHALFAILRSPLFGLSDDILHELKAGKKNSLWQCLSQKAAEPDEQELLLIKRKLQDWQRDSGTLPVHELLRKIILSSAFDVVLLCTSSGKQKSRNVFKFLSLACQYKHMDISEFLRSLKSMRDLGVKNLTDAPLSADNAVKIMTIHKSKGLEFAAVALPRLGRSAFQHSDKLLFGKDLGIALDCTRDREELKPSFFVAASNLSRKMDEEEKKRLLYVALTRSRDYLGIFMTPRCKSGTNFGNWLIQALDLPLPEGEIAEDIVCHGDGEESCRWLIRQDLPAPLAAKVVTLDTEDPLAHTDDPSAHTDDPFAHTDDPFAHTEDPSTHTDFSLLNDGKHSLQPTYTPVPWQALLRACPVETDGTVHATIAGNYFHLLMSSLGPDLQLPSEENRRALLLSHEVDVHDKRQQERLLQESEMLLITFKNSSLYQLMKTALRRIEESAYIIVDPESGDKDELRPDLIIEDKDQNWHIIDYKTDHLEARQVSRQVAAHRAQLVRYVTDMETLLGVRAKAWIYFAQLGRLEPVDINQPAQLSLF